MSEVIKIEVADQSVSVPIDKKTLGQFISGLLGQPQSLSKEIEAPFVIDQSWLVHLCSLVLQRISQQNAPEPISFIVEIGYIGGLSRQISSLNAFEHFSETQNAICESVKIKISLLIHFPGKETPEKQEITVAFKAKMRTQSALEAIFGKSISAGEMSIEIRHTERTWADDLLNLITKEFESVQAEETRLKKFLRKFFLPFSSLLFPLSFLIGSVVLPITTKGSTDTITKNINNLISSKEVGDKVFNAKLNALLEAENFTLNKAAPNIELSYIAYFVTAIMILIIGVILSQPAPSFILVSKASERNKKQVEERQKKKLIIAGASMVGSLILGIAGNYIYDHLK